MLDRKTHFANNYINIVELFTTFSEIITMNDFDCSKKFILQDR